MQDVTQLADLRRASLLTAQQVAQRVARMCGETSRTKESIYMIESRGTRHWDIIHALAAIYGRDPAEIAQLSAPKK